MVSIANLKYKDALQTNGSGPFCQLLALQLILLPASLMVITVLAFWLTLPITAFHFLLAVLVTIGVSFLPVKKKKILNFPEKVKNSRFLMITAAFLLLILIGLFLSMGAYDFSQDGQAYHQPAVIALAKGWNPFYQPFIEKHNPLYKNALKGNEIYVNHYPKASWITAACVYRLTGSLESGKLFNFLLLAAAFLITWNFLSHFSRIPRKSKVIVAALTAMNPVALYQLFSFYNDTQLASLTTITIILAFHYIIFREEKAPVYLSITLLTLSHIKFTGLVYGVVITAVAWLAVFIIDKDRQTRFIKMMVPVFLMAVVILGYQPYITNLVYKGNPFYPAVRTGGETNTAVKTVIGKQAPKAFMEKDRFSKLFYSLFSKSDYRLAQMPQLKIPFSIADSEMRTFNTVDARYGGFGPLFGSVLLLVLGTAVFVLFNARRLVLLFTFIPVAVILISSFVNPEAWWARLTPQLWLLPIIFITAFYYIPRDNFGVYARRFALSILLLNSLLMVTKHAGHSLTLTARFKSQMAELTRETRQKDSVVLVYPGTFYLSVQNRLNHFDIRHRMVKTLKSKKKTGKDFGPVFRLVGTPNAKICIQRR